MTKVELDILLESLCSIVPVVVRNFLDNNHVRVRVPLQGDIVLQHDEVVVAVHAFKVIWQKSISLWIDYDVRAFFVSPKDLLDQLIFQLCLVLITFESESDKKLGCH